MPRIGTPAVQIRVRGAVLVDARRAARQDEGPRAAGLERVPRGVERDELRVHVELAHAPGDELRGLAAEVQDDDLVRGVHEIRRVRVRFAELLRGARGRGDAAIRLISVRQWTPPLAAPCPRVDGRGQVAGF